MNAQPKYLTLRNPSEESRRSVFFGEDTIRGHQPLLLTEGPFDAMRANQIGFAAIATRGIHVSKFDLPHLVRLCKKAGSSFLIFDTESTGAGRKGAAALGERLWRQGIKVKIVILPLSKGQNKIDLAEFTLRRSGEATKVLAKLISQAPTWLEWQIENIPKDIPHLELAKKLRPLLLMISELAGIERDHYRQLIRSRFDLPRRAIDDEMQMAVLHHKSKQSIDATHARLSAEDVKAAMALLQRESLLYDFKCIVQRQGVSREGRNILLLGLAMTSRLLEEPLSVVVKGQSSGGKSFLVGNVAHLFPREDVLQWSGMSSKVLIYTNQDFRHKVLIIFERKGAEAAQESMRYLQSEKKLVYEVVVKDPRTGEFETVKYEKEGPITFVTTTTEAAMEVDDENRSFSISPDESGAQTARIMSANLRQKLAPHGDNRPTDQELHIWHNSQRLLARHRVRIVLPGWFEDVRKKLPTKPLRIRRDWPRFLALCEVVAFLRQFQRPRKELPDGSVEIPVTLEDYAMARMIVRDTFRSSLYQLPQNTQKIIEAVRDCNLDHAGTTYQDIVKKTGMTYAVVYRWAKPALQAGYLNYGSRTEKSNQKRIRLGTSPSKDELLTSPKLLLKLHPEIQSCKYISPLSGKHVSFKAPLRPQKAIKVRSQEP